METVTETTVERNLEYIKLQWADIHHSRQQEWKALAAVAGIYLAIAQVGLPEGQAALNAALGARIFLGLLGALSAFLGACISWQHHTIFLHKISVINKLERQIGIQYPMRSEPFSVQVLLFLLFGGICSAFVGITLGYGADAVGRYTLRFWAYGVGVVVFLAGFLQFAYVRRREATKAASYGFSHPFYAEMGNLERCLAFLGDVPLKLVVGGTLDRPGIREVPWESPRWAWHSDYKTITKAVLLNQRDVFQFSLANASSKQDWHRHSDTFEIYVSNRPMELEYGEPGAEERIHVNQGVLIVPPGVRHEAQLQGNTFVFQATLAGQGLGEDKGE
jgi:general stress protein CsbA